MVLTVLRALFVLLMAAVGWFYLGHAGQPGTESSWLSLPVSLTLAVFFVCVDILSPRRKLAIFAGSFFGLIVGIAMAFALSFAVKLLVDEWVAITSRPVPDSAEIEKFFNLVCGIVCCYLAISFTLQTKDDFRFIIPYVEFSKQTKGPRPILLDTSVLIDGRINDIAATGIFDSQLIVPRFVLDELQAVADSPDKLKRNRGRRGLDVLTALRGSRADTLLYEPTREVAEGSGGVDQKLMALAKDLRARVLTNDYNLNKVAQLNGVEVININDLSNALKPVVLPGEKMSVTIVKPGEAAGQGVGYLADGTMVVVEQAHQFENEMVEFTVVRALQTSAGRMVFGRLGDATAPPTRRTRPQSNPQSTAS